MKKLFAIAFAVVLCFALGTVAMAAVHHNEEGWSALQNDEILRNANYYVSVISNETTKTVDVNFTVFGNVTLCLNGKTLDMQGNQITVGSNATLTICDCSEGKTGKIIGALSKEGDNGGLIYNEGTVNITGGTVKNTGYSYSTFQAVLNKGTLNISGGTVISEGIETVTNFGTFEMTGGAVENTNENGGLALKNSDGERAGTATISGGELGNIKTENVNGQLYFTGSPTVGDISYEDGTIYAAKNSVSYTGGQIEIDVNNPEGKLGQTIVKNVTAGENGNAKKFVLDSNDYWFVEKTEQDNSISLVLAGNHKHENTEFDALALASAGETTPVSGNYYLENAATAAGNIVIGDGTNEITVTLCLNGKILNLGRNQIEVKEKATLNICDCSTGKTGKITGIYVGTILNSGTVTVSGGTVEGETGESTAAIQNSKGATLNVLEGATIKGYGSGIYNLGTANIYGGTIRGDSSNTGIGSGISNHGGTVKINGGTITGGNYGVYNVGDGTVTKTGNATVNGTHDVYNEGGFYQDKYYQGNNLFTGTYNGKNYVDGIEVAPAPEDPKPEPCSHKLDANGKCAKCGVVIITYTEKQEAETNPNTGAPVFGLAAILGAMVFNK